MACLISKSPTSLAYPSARCSATSTNTLRLLLPSIARWARKPVDRLTLTDVSGDRVRQFLNGLEEDRKSGIATRNQRLTAIHALARFIGLHAPGVMRWVGPAP